MLKILEANPIEIGDMRITPRARVAHKPGQSGLWLWARPADVIVETADSTRVLPIPDPTRAVVLACFVVSAIAMLWTVLSPSSHRKETDQ